MNNERINIAEILRDCPKGTKLYSPICGSVLLDKVDEHIKCTAECASDVYMVTDSYGHVFCGASGAVSDISECVLFPSKGQRDWSKFFPYHDGDFVDITTSDGILTTAIVKSAGTDSVLLHVDFCKRDRTLDYNLPLRLGALSFKRATNEHVKELHEALQRKGKRWNGEMKRIEPIEEPHTFTPFERVLVRDADDDTWGAALFLHMATGDIMPFHVAPDVPYRQCIPYLGNEHLLGTTNDK